MNLMQDQYYNLKIYWMTPLGKALKESILEMGITGDLEDKIYEIYEKAMEKEFETAQGGHNRTSSAAPRNKLVGDCKHYNNIY